MFFESFSSLGRTLLAGVFAYTALVLFLRISGKRTLAKMNAFDLVVTVALGSTLSAVLTSRSLPLADGLLSLALLVVLQFVVAWMSVRSRPFEQMIKSRPATVFREGRFENETMRRERLAEDEVLAAIRGAGIMDRDRVAMVVLETDGSLSVLHASSRGEMPLTR